MTTVNADTPKTRKCPKCKQLVPIHEFSSNIAHHTGFGSYCLVCTRLIRKSRYKPTNKNGEKRKQIYMETANQNNLYWCSGFNATSERASNGHLANISDFSFSNGKRKNQCKECRRKAERFYWYRKQQAKQAVQE